MWIAPDDSRAILLGSDQGAVISVDGGASWSSWYNQPTAQFYHVATDERFPYRVYGGQQESGSAEVRSRGNDGAITMRDWHPVGTEEYGYVAPDPLHPGVVYGGKVTRWDETTGQTREVGPVVAWRGNPHVGFRRTAPLAFSPIDPHALYLAGNIVFCTRDGGAHWSTISPDLTRTAPVTPPNLGIFAHTDDANAPHPGVVYALGLSPRDRNVIWAGTDDGLVWHTGDGGAHWSNVTPPGLEPWAKVSIVEPSPFDTAGAYVAVNRFRLDEQRPQLLRTRDGATWSCTATISSSRRTAAASGSSTTSRRLRQAASLRAERPALLAPARARRVASDTNTDTPLPPDEPFAANPPDGAVFDYILPRDAQRVTLTVLDAQGRALWSLASDASAAAVDPATLNVPAWWIAPPPRLDRGAGVHRFVWNLRVAAPHAFDASPAMAAVPHRAPLEPQGAVVPPGTYRAVLDVDGTRSVRTLHVEQDPRVPVSRSDLEAQFALARAVAGAIDVAYAGAERVRARDTALAQRLERANARLVQLLAAVESGDGAPTEVQRIAFHDQRRRLDELLRTARR